jgi:hypothetical protein
MDANDIQALDKEVRRLKRIASEWAGKLHDLVEDRLPAAYQELPAICTATFEACQDWEQAQQKLAAAQNSDSLSS